MPGASGQEKGTGQNPKGVLADDRNFNKDSNDRNNSDHESDEKSPVHLQPALGSFRGHELFRPLCCEILDPLEFERRRFAFPDDSRPFTLVEG